MVWLDDDVREAREGAGELGSLVPATLEISRPGI